jgi:8-oxo-dGTP diphosphatase
MPSANQEVLVVAAVIRDGPRVLAARRLPGGAAGGRWEFPGAKVEPNESPRAALAREIQEELGLSIEAGACLGEFTSPQAQLLIRLLCFWSHVLDGEVLLNAHSAVKWCDPTELQSLDWANADLQAMAVVLEKLTNGSGQTSV